MASEQQGSLYDMLGIEPAARHLIARTGRAELAAGRIEDAVETLRVATSLDPGDRGAWTALMAACRRAGRTAEADAIAELLDEGGL